MCDSHTKSHKETPPKLCRENPKKRLRKSPKRGNGRGNKSLDELRRIIYTYHEGTYKVYLASQSSYPLSTSHMKLSS
jgi:hypothetical protein